MYGSKELSPLAVALVDTPEFQRLGHIYQLGTTYVAFRGANHKRFEHCVGTYFMSRTLLRRVVQNHARLHKSDPSAFRHPGAFVSPAMYVRAPGTPANAQCLYSPMGRWRGITEVVSAAALLHDLGHVAVGHTFEDEFSVLSKHDGLGGYRLFTMLYGPRRPIEGPTTSRATGSPLSTYFGPIDQTLLPAPRDYDLRIPLPWVFETDVYEPIFPRPTYPGFGPKPVDPLTNEEVRDLIFLILSFKETVEQKTYLPFAEELAAAIKAAESEPNLARLARLRFIEALHERYSRPLGLSPDLAAVPVFHPFMADVVGNTICADLLDYLVRDGNRLNLDIRNNPRLQRYLVIRPEGSFVRVPPEDAFPADAAKSLRLTIHAVYKNGLARRDTVSDLLDLMRERFRFAEVVYYHPKKCAFSAMLAKAMELAGNRAPRDDEDVYPAPWAIPDGRALAAVPHIVHLGDDGLAEYLSGLPTAPNAREIATLVRQVRFRDEYRLLYTLDASTAGESGGALKFIHDLRKRDGGKDVGRRELEAVLAKVVARSGLQARVGNEPAVLLYCPNIRMQAKEVAARAELTPGRVIPLNRQGEESALVAEIQSLNLQYQRLWRLYLFLHPLLVRDTNGAGTVVYSTLVDVFGDRYDIPQDYRSQGARLPYLSLRERVEAQFGKWRGSESAPFLSDDLVRKAIIDVASRRSLWESVLEAEQAKYPITEDEFHRGLARAATIAAAVATKPVQREQWKPSLRAMDAGAWLSRAGTADDEADRLAALARLHALEQGFAGHRIAAKVFQTWEDLVGKVATEIEKT